MTVWSMAAAAILAGTAAGVGTQQATQVAQPAPAVTIVSEAMPSGYVLAQTASDQEESQRVSASFNHAAVSEVMDWLIKNGVSFVTADSELPKDATITLNVKDEPINEVVDAIANALGGHWQRRGSMRIFRKGEGFEGFGGNGTLAFPGQGEWKSMPKMKSWTGKPGEGNFFDKDGHVFVMPDMPNMKEFHLDMDHLKSLKDMPDMKEFRIDMDHLKSLKDMPGMDEQSRKELENALRSSRIQIERSGDAMKISRKAMEEARKEMEKARKEHPEAFEGRVFMSPSEDGMFRVVPNGKGKTFEYRLSPKGMKGAKPSFMIDGKSFTKFINSLSPEQREQNRRQGYLRARDLSEAQRKILGVDSREKGWSITINKDGEQVTVKSND